MLPSPLPAHVAEAAQPPVEVVSIDTLEHETAVKYGLNEYLLKEVVKCESDNVVDAVGDRGTSIGLAQIHLPSHPEVSQEQAEDPVFALDWLGRMWAQGYGYQWTCYRKLA